MSEQTPHRWRNQFGGMKGEEMKRLKEFERADARRERLVADLALDNRMLKDLAEGKFWARSADGKLSSACVRCTAPRSAAPVA